MTEIKLEEDEGDVNSEELGNHSTIPGTSAPIGQTPHGPPPGFRPMPPPPFQFGGYPVPPPFGPPPFAFFASASAAPPFMAQPGPPFRPAVVMSGPQEPPSHGYHQQGPPHPQWNLGPPGVAPSHNPSGYIPVLSTMPGPPGLGFSPQGPPPPLPWSVHPPAVATPVNSTTQAASPHVERQSGGEATQGRPRQRPC
ncbi:hypothetical protein HDV00_009476 [Rhizophlyctis rosea]|nr:hypothetical protein HDV00_009476 [Rhizophlyctis rosea]